MTVAESNVFPAFIRLQVDDQDGFAQFNTKLANELNRAKRTTEVSLGEIERVISGAITGGQIGNFTVDTKGAREAAVASEQRAESARKMAVALQVAAASENNYSAAAQAAVVAAARVATEETEAARAARVHADAVDYLKQALDRQGVSVNDSVDHNSRLTRSNSQLRMAYVQTGQQLQDVTISMMGGQRASVVFAQQLPQLAFALSGLGIQADGTQKGIGRLATFLSGPWGVAFTGAAFAVGMLVEKLWQADDVSKKASDSFDTFGDAQSKLAQIIDLTTGAMASQNIVLREAIRLEAIKDKRDAEKALAAGRDSLSNLRLRSNITSSLSMAGPGTSMAVGGQVRDSINPRDERRLEQIIDRYIAGDLTETQVRKGIDYLDQKKMLGDLSAITILEEVLKVGKSRNEATSAQGIIDAIDGKGLPDWARKPGSSSPTARLNAQARLDAADTPLEVARAELALEKATSAELLKQGKITEAQYLSNVRVKEIEVQRQQGLKEATAQGEKAAKAYQRLLDFGSKAAESIQRISEQFDDQPRLVDRAAQSTRKLDSIIAELAARKPPGFQEMIADAERAKVAVENGLTKPYRDLIKQMDQDLTIGQLILDGREAEADALRTILALKEKTGSVDAEQVRNIVELTEKLREQEKMMQKLRDQQQPYLNALADMRSSITETFADFRTEGASALGDFVSRFRRTFDNLSAEVLFETTFGDIFREIENGITGRDKELRTDIINNALLSTAAKAEVLGNSMAEAANKIANAPVAAANDNSAQEAYAEIVVTGRKAMDKPVEFLADTLEKLFRKFLPDNLAKEVGKYVSEAVQGAAYGQMAGGLLLGSSNSKIGSSIGGAAGNIVGKELTKNLTGLLGKFGGPLGSIAGGILGGAIGGLFTSAKWGTAAVSGNSDGDVAVGGNKSAYRSNASLAATSIQSGLASIAEQFGVDVGDYAVSIGQYKGKWRVSTTGRTGKLKGGSSRTDIRDFGEEGAEDAIKYAIADAVKDGALQGLRASTQALLAASDDVEAQLQKALDFEDVFSRLKSYKDPVGAALDTLDKEFTRLRNIFEEAGASAEEYAQLEELYGIERAAAVKEAAERVTSSLQSLFDDLTVGNDARSLRDRLVEAQAAYSPLAQRVAAGDTTAYDDYADAAQTLLDLQRQIYGSSEEYFQLLDQVTALTKTRIDAEANIASISEGRDPLFASDTSLAPVVSATESQTAQLVSVLKTELGAQRSDLQAISSNIIALTRSISVQGGSNDGGLSVVRNNF
ncbi:MAG: hypothetical protein VYA35_07070 [Pseudomonadota bacterium]|nr:hypothetical protein [Pseudomonadota bacterium]